MTFPNNKAEMKKREVHNILAQVLQKAYRWNNAAYAYHSIAQASQTLYPPPTVYTLKVCIRRLDRLDETKFSSINRITYKSTS